MSIELNATIGSGDMIIDVLQEADSYLSLIGYRYGSELPGMLAQDLQAASARCRRLIQDIKGDQSSRRDVQPRIAYLFGPVSGQLETAKTDFARAQTLLERLGYEVWNPLTRANNPAAEAEALEHGKAAAGKPGWQSVMRPCFRDVLGADELFGLPGWETSTGARLEVFLASVIGTPVFEMATGRLLETGQFELLQWRPNHLTGDRIWPR